MNLSLTSEGFTENCLGPRLTNHWASSVDLSLICATVGTPVFVYSEAQLIKNVRRIKSAISAAGLDDRVSIYVPFFPNANPHILQPLRNEDVGILLQMPNEYAIMTHHGFSDFIISPGHISNDEIAFWNTKGYPTFLASIDEIAFALSDEAETISVRIDSLGSDKPGVKVEQLANLAELLKSYDRNLECFEVYCGSGNSLDNMVDIVRQIFQIYLDHFPTARSINFAGGHGFDYEKWDEAEKHFDWETYFREIQRLAKAMGIPETLKFLFEPARDVLADIGVLVAGVKRNIVTHSIGSIVVTDGSRMLMPSAQLRNRPHNTVFLDSQFREIPENAQTTACKIRGRSILRNDYILSGEAAVPNTVRAGDYLMILDVGAYCATQHMEFLNVPPAGEVLVDAMGGQPHLVTRPGDELDKWRNVLPEREVIAAE
jgi:diaminopimelate decarboxylase